MASTYLPSRARALQLEVAGGEEVRSWVARSGLAFADSADSGISVCEVSFDSASDLAAEGSFGFGAAERSSALIGG
jgi:hypothetical protein